MVKGAGIRMCMHIGHLSDTQGSTTELSVYLADERAYLGINEILSVYSTCDHNKSFECCKFGTIVF